MFWRWLFCLLEACVEKCKDCTRLYSVKDKCPKNILPEFHFDSLNGYHEWIFRRNVIELDLNKHLHFFCCSVYFNLNYPQVHQNPPPVLPDFDGFNTPQYIPVDRACIHVYQIHQTPPAAFVGFRTVYIVKPWMLCILLLYQIHPSPTIGLPFYCMLMDFRGFRMVSSKNVKNLMVCLQLNLLT